MIIEANNNSPFGMIRKQMVKTFSDYQSIESINYNKFNIF